MDGGHGCLVRAVSESVYYDMISPDDHMNYERADQSDRENSAPLMPLNPRPRAAFSFPSISLLPSSIYRRLALPLLSLSFLYTPPAHQLSRSFIHPLPIMAAHFGMELSKEQEIINVKKRVSAPLPTPLSFRQGPN